ncbi:MAG: hypothetical protein F6K50_52830 [Moorea sp. SIO3I7]|uniref:hypothetical protein n=1 Tax=unclassified Moorena TaxID=2683338 RepID=UPI0013BFE1F0|nr:MULTISPECIES: hypothetical protein [unclassified Moorena]NEO03673.1 hypothetical protein [Moorena sp. SIO3I7]NEO06351.1 hypothetical protein [Moorena sp. SIO3I8]NEQ61232.1 hypothetical protein [Moorena sp. SIO4A1]
MGILHYQFTILHSDRQPWPKGHALRSKAGRSPSRSTYPTPNRLGLTTLNLGLWPRDRVQPPTFNLQPICH